MEITTKLEAFLIEFVPKAERRRRTLNNEIESIHRIVDLVFLKFATNRVNIEDLKRALENLGYGLNTGDLEKDSKLGLTYTERFSKHSESGRAGYNTHFFADAAALKELKLVVKTLPDNTNEKKMDAIEDLNGRLKRFFRENPVPAK